MYSLCDKCFFMVIITFLSSCQIKSNDKLVNMQSLNVEKKNYILAEDSVCENEQKIISELQDSLKNDFPTYYGGCSVANNRLVIIVVGEDTSAMRTDLIKIIGRNDFVIDVGNYNYKTLIEAQGCIEKYIDFNKDGCVAKNIESYKIKGNRVLVYLKDDSYECCQKFRQYVTDSPAVGLTKKKDYFNTAD